VDFFLTLIISGLMTGIIYGLVAVGFVLIFKASGVFNLAQGEMLLLGAYLVWMFIVPFGFPVWLAIIAGLAASFLLGWLTQRVFLQPLLGESMLALIMATIALGQFFRGIVAFTWGSQPRPYAAILPSMPFELGNLVLSREHIYGAAISAVLLLALAIFFRYSRWGLAMRGVAEGHQIVRSMGVSVKSIIALSWGIAAIVATVGGVIIGSISGFSQNLAVMGIFAIPAAFIGGLNSIPGAIVGGLLVGLVESLASGYIGMGSGTAVAFILLIVVMIFRPHGLWGLVTIERV